MYGARSDQPVEELPRNHGGEGRRPLCRNEGTAAEDVSSDRCPCHAVLIASGRRQKEQTAATSLVVQNEISGDRTSFDENNARGRENGLTAHAVGTDDHAADRL